jgi:hypothetical protein
MSTAAMQTPDGTWRVEVGGVGSIAWYTVIGPGVTKAVPSLAKLTDVLGEAGVDLSDFIEPEPTQQAA